MCVCAESVITQNDSVISGVIFCQSQYPWHELILKSLNNAVRTEYRNPSQHLPILCLPFKCFPKSHGSELQSEGVVRIGTGSHQSPEFLARRGLMVMIGVSSTLLGGGRH